MTEGETDLFDIVIDQIDEVAGNELDVLSERIAIDLYAFRKALAATSDEATVAIDGVQLGDPDKSVVAIESPDHETLFFRSQGRDGAEAPLVYHQGQVDSEKGADVNKARDMFIALERALITIHEHSQSS